MARSATLRPNARSKNLAQGAGDLDGTAKHRVVFLFLRPPMSGETAMSKKAQVVPLIRHMRKQLLEARYRSRVVVNKRRKGSRRPSTVI